MVDNFLSFINTKEINGGLQKLEADIKKKDLQKKKEKGIDLALLKKTLPTKYLISKLDWEN